MDAAVAERPYRPAVRLALADLMLAAAVGLLSGALALGTRELLLAITRLTTNNHAFAGAFAVDTPNYASIGVATRLVLPLGGGLLCSWLMVALASTATSHLFCGATIYLKGVGAATGDR